jgi:hypothetical protein
VIQIRLGSHILILFAIAIPLFAQASHLTANSPECDEFISSSPCVVTFDLKMATTAPNETPRVPTHADVQTRVHGNAGIHLIHASPFLTCTVQATPATPTRDLSTSVTTGLTTLGAAGAVPIEARSFEVAAPPPPPPTGYVADLKKKFQDAIAPLKYSYDTAADAQSAVTKLYTDLYKVLQNEKDDEAGVEASGARAFDIRDQLDDLRKIRDSAQQYFDFVSKLVTVVAGQPIVKNTVSNDILIDMDRFRQKSVSETITCKDTVTQTQTFATMTFTAYYENTPVFDISAGAIMSLTPGRQVGVVAGPLGTGTGAATPGPCAAQSTPLSCLGVTSQSRIQFMPAAFVEWHRDWKWPGVRNGRAYHPFGYVGSLGPAFGIAVNPNNGTASAEFFEGVSLGIHRVAIMAGFHNGRYQTFADGYYVGEAVPSTVTSPRTERIWTTHFAIAVSYRIPFR